MCRRNAKTLPAYSSRAALCPARRVQNAIALVFLVVVLIVLVLVAAFADTPFNPFFGRDGNQPGKYAFSVPLACALVLACLLLLASVLLLRRLEKRRGRALRFGVVLVVGSVVLAFLQVLIVRCTYYEIVWDPGILLEYAKAAATGGALDAYKWYFDMFPNNCFLAVVFKYLAKFSLAAGLDSVFVSAVVGALLANVSGVMLAFAVRTLTGASSIAYFSWLAFSFLACLSPWIAVPYSDTYLLPFVAGALLLSTVALRGSTGARRRFACCFAWGLCVFLGSLIKPTILVLLVAAVFLLAVDVLAKTRRLGDAAHVVGACALAAVVCFCAVSPLAESRLGLGLDDERATSAAHYLMMGANPDRFGSFDFDDYAFSRQIDSYDERQKENTRVFFERLGAFGPLGYVEFLGKKLLITFDDGTFNVGGEGQSLPPENGHVLPNPYGGLSGVVRAAYYFDCDTPSPLKELEQVVWLSVLMSLPFAYGYFRRCARGAGGMRRGGDVCRGSGAGDMRCDADVDVCRGSAHGLRGGDVNADTDAPRAVMAFLFLSLLGVVLFLLLFETRSRYLYCFLPLIVLVSSLGMSFLASLAHPVKWKRAARAFLKDMR